MFPKKLFCADHFDAFRLFILVILHPTFIRVESFYFNFFIKIFIRNK